MNEMKKAMDASVEKVMYIMVKDYREWSDRGDSKNYEIRMRMADEYETKIRYEVGRKYIKVIHDNSVSLFVVNCTDDKKFQYGDCLKPAGWRTPARNFARCNVFDTISCEKNIRWTGL